MKKHILQENYERFFVKNSLNEYSLSDSDNLWDPNGVEDRQIILKALKKDNAEMKGILNKLKSYVHPNHHYLYFKEKKDVYKNT